MSLRQRHKADRLGAIKAAARALFAEHGFEATTTREIAKRAGVGVGTVFLHAPTKGALLAMVFAEDIPVVYQRAFAELPEELPFLDAVTQVFGSLFAFYAQNRGLARVFAKELSFLDPVADRQVTAINIDFGLRLARVVARAQARGELDPELSPLAVASNLFASYYLALLLWLSGQLPNEASRDAWFRQSLELQLNGLRRAS